MVAKDPGLQSRRQPTKERLQRSLPSVRKSANPRAVAKDPSLQSRRQPTQERTQKVPAFSWGGSQPKRGRKRSQPSVKEATNPRAVAKDPSLQSRKWPTQEQSQKIPAFSQRGSQPKSGCKRSRPLVRKTARPTIPVIQPYRLNIANWECCQQGGKHSLLCDQERHHWWLIKYVQTHAITGLSWWYFTGVNCQHSGGGGGSDYKIQNGS